jgi:ELWxxDGT repeat protein
MKTLLWIHWLKSIRHAEPARPVSRNETRRRTLFLEALEARVVPSQAPHMLLDINPTTLSSSPSGLVAIGSTTYFSADDGFHAPELWKSDGTVAGTTSLSDAIDPADLTNVNGTLLFAAGDAGDGIHGRELWKSDGTVAGTVLVKDIVPGYLSSYPGNLTAVNGTLFFTTRSQQLWRSDGTAAGTVMVKDLYSSTARYTPGNLTNVNGTLFFSAAGVNGMELWKSDGTAAGTNLVKDIWPGGVGSYPGGLTAVNGTLFFSAAADDVTHGRELWKSDGTAAGTVLVKDIYLGSASSNPANLTNVNGTLFFSATDGVNGVELWKSDGTTVGTVIVKNINPGSASSSPGNLTDVNGTLFFSATDGVNGVELWKSDGTAGGTLLVKDINQGSVNSNPGSLTNVNGILFLSATDATHGQELWKSDGTSAGTTLIKDIDLGSASSSPSFLTNVNGTLFLAADDGIHGAEPWKSDGTAAGTVLVKDINSTSTSGSGHASDFTSVGGTTYFVADDGIGNGLWKTDGTTAGTTLVKEFGVAGDYLVYPSYLTNLHGTLFFTASGSLWKSDGTAAGTSPLVSGVSSADPLTNVNGTLFFTANDGAHGDELWKSDGTVAGTTLVKDIYPGEWLQKYGNPYTGYYFRYIFNSSNPSSLTNVNGTLFFTAYEGTDGRELWKSDGTAAGTVLVKDIYPTTVGSSASYLTNVNGTLFFEADDGTHGYELWKSDGTVSGTTLVKDINPGSANSYPTGLTNVNGTLFFVADDGIQRELWKSDGTTAGTTMVKDIYPGTSVGYYGGVYYNSSSPGHLTNVNGTLFFSATDANGVELWKSDGSAGGTVLVKGFASSGPGNLTNVNGILYFAANDGTHGNELWQSDGTAGGTTLVMDINPISASSYPASLTNVNGTLFFRADDGVHGPQPWVLPAASSTPTAANLTASAFPASTTAGVIGNFTVTAWDAYGNLSTNYTGTVHFTSGDPRKSLPADYTFTAADAGMHTFSATLRTAGLQSITATDTVNASIQSAQTGILVLPNVVTHFNVALFPNPEVAGVTGVFRVIARDAYNNTVPNYTGTVHFTTSDPAKGARLPANYTFTSTDKGIHTFHATLFTAGTQSLTATATVTSSITGSQTGIVITPAALNHFRVYGFPNPTTAGATHTVWVQAKDLYGNAVTNYTGIIAFTSSDPLAGLPGPYTFTAADAGTHSFTVTLKTVGTQSITIGDTNNTTITGKQVVAVNPAPAPQSDITGPRSVPLGSSHPYVVAAYDAFGSYAAGSSGTVHFTSGDTGVSLPAEYTFTAADASRPSITSRVTLTRATTNTMRSAIDRLFASLKGSLTGIEVA